MVGLLYSRAGEHQGSTQFSITVSLPSRPEDSSFPCEPLRLTRVPSVGPFSARVEQGWTVLNRDTRNGGGAEKKTGCRFGGSSKSSSERERFGRSGAVVRVGPVRRVSGGHGNCVYGGHNSYRATTNGRTDTRRLNPHPRDVSRSDTAT